MFQRRFKCFKRVANIQNTLLIFQTLCEYSKKRFKSFKRVADI